MSVKMRNGSRRSWMREGMPSRVSRCLLPKGFAH